MTSLSAMTAVLFAGALGTITKLAFDEWQNSQEQRRRALYRRKRHCNYWVNQSNV